MSHLGRVPRLRHDAARRRAAGGPGALRRRQARHRAAPGRPRRRLHRGRLAGRQPQGHRVLRRARTELDLSTRSSPRSARPAEPGDQAADDPQVAALRDSGAAVVTLVAKSHDAHVELALRTTLDENLAMVADTVRHLRDEGQRVFLDAEHFFDGYRSQPRVRRSRCCESPPRPAPTWSCSATPTAARCPPESQDVVRDVLERRRRPARHPLPQRRRLRGGQLAGRRRRRAPRTCRARSTATASAPATPTCSASSPTSSSSADRRCCPAGRLGEIDPDRARDRRGDERAALDPPALRRCVRLRPQGGAARQRDQGRPDLYQHTDPAQVGNDMRDRGLRRAPLGDPRGQVRSSSVRTASVSTRIRSAYRAWELSRSW